MAPITTILALLAVSTSAYATPLHDRRLAISADTIIADIDAIDVGVNTLRAEIAAYTGGLLSATGLLGGFTEIELSNRKGYVDANLASPFDAADSTAIVESVQNTVEIDIPASIEEIKAKKPLFEESGEDALIVATLKILLYDHDSFSAAVSQKLTADLEAGAAAIAVIHDAIQSGIDYFSN